MPFRKSRTRSKKRNYRKKIFTRGKFVGKTNRYRIVTRSKDPFPDSMFTVLNYNSAKNIAGVGLNGYNFVLNGPYDPDAAVGGSQPRYYDTLLGANNTAAPYSNYVVYGAKVIVDFWNNSASVPAIAGITGFPSDSSAPSDATEALERRMETKYVKLSPNTGGTSNARLSRYYSIKHLEGVADVNDNANLSANYNAVPTRVSQVSMWAEAADNGASSCNVISKITVIYYIQLRKKNKVPQS